MLNSLMILLMQSCVPGGGEKKAHPELFLYFIAPFQVRKLVMP
jgi:hypothetical protein